MTTTDGVVLRVGALAMQVCVPADWTDEQIREFAERANPSGTTGGWYIRREGDPALRGTPERAQCAQFEDRVHVVLDA